MKCSKPVEMWARRITLFALAMTAFVGGACSADDTRRNKNSQPVAIGGPCNPHGAGGECTSRVCTVVTCGNQEFGVCAGPDCREELPCTDGLICLLVADGPGRCAAPSTLQQCPQLIPGNLGVGDACLPTPEGAAGCPYRRCDYILCPDNSQFNVCSGRDCSAASACPPGQDCLEARRRRASLLRQSVARALQLNPSAIAWWGVLTPCRHPLNRSSERPLRA